MKFKSPIIVLEKNLPGLNSRALENFIRKANAAAGLQGVVTVLITGNSSIRRLNARFRGKDQSTDVLSFPAGPIANGCGGDIAVSLDMAARSARLLGHSLSAEIRILILHGILHLAGYDHENDGGEMAKKEISLRQRFVLPTGLIERSSEPSARLKSAKRALPFARSRR